MKKLLLIVVTFFSLAALWTIPAMVGATQITVTAKLSATSSACDTVGSITPSKLVYSYNDAVTLRLQNTSDIKLEVRDMPGGTFTITPSETVERSFTAKGDFVYAIWSVDPSCEKATGEVHVKGGWLIRIWPWALALVGSALVVWIIGKTGRKNSKPAAE